MNTQRMKRVAAFVGVGLPALVASAGQSADPQAEQAVSLCLAAPEKSLECKDEVVQAWITLRNPPERQRAKLRKKMLEALVAGGAEPRHVRREKCEQLAASAAASGSSPAWSQETMTTMRRCFARPDCAARATCIAQLMVAEALPEVGPADERKPKR